jgi:hypothetical protein
MIVLEFAINNVTALILISAGIFTLILFLAMVIEKVSSKNWPSTVATISDRRIERIQNKNDSRDRHSYSTQVTLTYSVDGIEYTTLLDTWQASDESEEAAKRRMEQYYPLGKTYQIFYKTSKPSKSLVDRSVGFLDFIILLLPIALISGGIYMLCEK